MLVLRVALICGRFCWRSISMSPHVGHLITWPRCGAHARAIIKCAHAVLAVPFAYIYCLALCLRRRRPFQVCQTRVTRRSGAGTCCRSGAGSRCRWHARTVCRAGAGSFGRAGAAHAHARTHHSYTHTHTHIHTNTHTHTATGQGW